MTKLAPPNRPFVALPRLLLTAALVLPAFGAQADVVLTSLHSFQVLPNGANPTAGLVQGSDGNFYGTTSTGGTNGLYGTVYKIDTNGALTTLYSFTGGDDGARPGALAQGSDGNFYGTTPTGLYTTYGGGTVFGISTNGALTTLHMFTGADGSGINDGLVQGNDGEFYGTAASGGTNGYGTVFKISTNGALTILHVFTSTFVYGFVNHYFTEGYYYYDGANPQAGLVRGSDGNFYGTTAYGGTNGSGTVFKMSPKGALTTLYSFTGTNDGGGPRGALALGSDGNLYGTTGSGGTNRNGTVFKISTNGALTTLYSFTGITDGAAPLGRLVQGRDGYFYGTTAEGGPYDFGTVFKVSTNGTLATLYSFTGGNDGADPSAGLVEGADGNFYGTAPNGGTNGYGVLFKITANGGLTGLYWFAANNDGASPAAALVEGADGNFYGTAASGGGGTNGGWGTVFKIARNGAFTSLHLFTGNDGADPAAALLQASDGSFYGTTYGGGTNGAGTVFRMTPGGALTSLYSFTGGNDGAGPSGLAQGSDGYFYGATYGGGTYTNGTLFKIGANGTLTTLYSFTGASDGANPSAGLVQAADSNFYGTTYGGGTNGVGTVFRMTPSGALTSLYSFTGRVFLPVNQPSPGNDGANPSAALVQGSDGNFYGTTRFGGAYIGFNQPNDAFYRYTFGTAFKITPAGHETVLCSFTGVPQPISVPTLYGANPAASLVQGSDGNFYGTTPYGWSPRGVIALTGTGTVFTMSTNGASNPLLASFGGASGANPSGALVQGSDGSFYGATSAGGLGGVGTIFRLTMVPEFQSFVPTNTALNLTWSTEAGGAYQLQYKPSLSSTNWTSLGSPVTATGATLSFRDSLTNAPRRFYRLVLQP